MKILVIFTGGTIGSSVSKEGYFAPDKEKAYKLLALYKEKYANALDEEILFDTAQPYITLSENLEITHLKLLTDCIKEHFDKNYDGVIVTHGSDTLQYTAAALGYLCGNDTIPILFVASNYILEDPRANGLDNFAGAVDFICQKAGKGVFVSYKNTGECTKYHRGTRLQVHPAHTDYLTSIDDQCYGSLMEGKVVKNLEYAEHEDEMLPLPMRETTGAKVLWLQAHPGMVFPAVDTSIKAVLITSYHSGTINTANPQGKAYYKSDTSNGIPVFLVGASGGMSYESTKEYKDMGISLLPKMAPIGAYIKLLLCLLHGMNLEDCLFKSLGGDII